MGLFDLFSRKRVSSNNDKDYPNTLDGHSFGSPKWSDWRDEAYITEAFNKLVWVYTCASIIGSNVSKVNWEVWRVGKGQNTRDRQIYEHPICDLLNKNINTHFSSKDFFELWALGLALQGKFYAKMNSPMYPSKLYCLYPHRTRPIPDRYKFVSGFEYRVMDEVETLKDDIVLWSKFNDPKDYYEGLSPLKAMARTVDTENEAVDWNKSQLQNQAVPPGAIMVENLGPDTRKTLRTEWMKRYAGPRNSRMPLILDASKVSYTQFGLSPVEMDFLGLRKVTRIEICAGFKVPLIVAGDPENQTYANYQEGVQSLWKQCIIPDYLDRMKDDLNLYIASRYADNIEIRYNLDDIDALQEAQDSKWQRGIDGYESGLLKKNEGREVLGYDEVEDGDKFIDIPKPNSEDEKKPKKEPKKELKKKSINLAEEEKEIFWKAQDKKKQDYEKAIKSKIEEYFDKQRKLVVNDVKNYKKAIKSTSKDLNNILQALYQLTIKEFGEEQYRKLANRKAEEEFSFDDAILKYIKEQTAKQVVQIDTTTESQIQNRIQLAQDEGLSIQKISKLIDDLYLENIIPNRSTVIARTETISSSNYGSLAGATQAQNDFDLELKKEWLRTYDARVRDTHAKAGDHEPIDLDKKFKVGNSELRFPGDFEGGVEEVANCRCAIAYIDPDDD